MTSYLQRRSPKPKELTNTGNGSRSSLTLLDGSHEILSAKSSSSSSPNRLITARQRRNRLSRAKNRVQKRVRLGILVSLATLLMSGCLFTVVQRTRQRQQQHRSPFLAVTEHAPVCRGMTADEVSYTLVTQLSGDRLWMMEHHCQRWGPHPISIAVVTNETAQKVRNRLTDLGCPRKQLFVQTIKDYYAQDYPVNLLRNMAMQKVTTSHVAYVDVDFWEATDLYTNLMTSNIRQHLADDPKAALVLPAWQLLRQCADWRECPEDNIPVMPNTKTELLSLYRHSNATQFDPSNRGGHGSTRYRDWLTQPAAELLPIDCVLSNRYEPYVVVRYCRDLPPWQTAFSGYGKNKMTWIMHLRRVGYTFWQLGESFVVHYPHLDSAARLQWNGGLHGEQLSKPDANTDLLQYKRAQTDRTFVEFRKWLHSNVPDHTRVGKCDNAMDDDSKLWLEREGEQGTGGRGDDATGDEEYDEEYDDEYDDDSEGSGGDDGDAESNDQTESPLGDKSGGSAMYSET